MATLLLQKVRPITRKQRLLEYLQNQENGPLVKKANEQQIDKEIEAVFEELVTDSDDAIYITNMEQDEEHNTDLVHEVNLKEQHKIETLNKPNFSESEAKEFEKYTEKFESVVETANILHKQLQNLTKNGIILFEDTDVSYDDAKAIVIGREHSPTPENKKKRRMTKKPVKRILHVTGDSTLEYFQDETISDVEVPEDLQNSSVQGKEKKHRASKKSPKNFVHITGDSCSESFDSEESTPKYSSSASESNDNDSSHTGYVSFPYVSHTNPDDMVIGPNSTVVNKHDFKNIDWALSAPIVTRKLLLYIFGREILSTHSLTGKPSPAFLDQKKPLKKPLDAKKVADIIYIVTKKKDVKPKEVRLTITSKCADEQKMRKTRMSK